jgi:predicted nuclease of predicted toxin-antitoxin system
MGVSKSTKLQLRSVGHDVVHLQEEGLERLPDSAILQKARLEGRVVLTFDLDFGELLSSGEARLPSCIIFRVQNQKPVNISSRVLDVIKFHEQDLIEGAIILVEDRRHRIRRLPINREE